MVRRYWFVAALLFVITARVLPASTKPPSFSAQEYAALKEKITSTPVEKIDAGFLREIYRGFPGAKYILKEILADPSLAAKNARMGRVRRSLDLQFWGRMARLKGITIELTDQGKADGHRSDLDETGWALVGPKGELMQRGRPFDELRRMHEDYFAKEHGIAPEQADITVMDGDIFLPDYRSAHMGSAEFVRDLSDKVYRLRRNSAAYFVPGANKQQVYNRALSEGRTIHISWDPVSGRTLINDTPFDIEAYIEGKASIHELAARDMAARYRGVSKMDQRRLALGNAVQNLREFLSSSTQSIVRQKYANRIVEEAFGPMTGQSGSYSLVHGGLPVLDEKGSRIAAEEWKQNFIEQIYGVRSGPEYEEIRRILDISADIELDKTGKRASGEKFDYKTRRNLYYRGELEEARRLLRDEGGKEPSEERVLEKAEQLFVAKNARILANGVVPVLKETLRRDLTIEGRRQFRADFGENYRSTVKKMLFERKIEIAVLFESLDLINDAGLRNSVRQELLEAAPNGEIRSLLERLSALAAVDGGIDEWLTEAKRRGAVPSPDEILAQIERRKSAVAGGEDGARVSTETMESRMLERIAARLGPKGGGDFVDAYQHMKSAARQFSSSYLKEFYGGLGPLLLGSSALNLVRTYQQDCLLGGRSGWDCSRSLLSAGAHEAFFYLPRISSYFLTMTSLMQINEGNSEGTLSLALGTASLLGFGSGMHIYFVYQIGTTGFDVTYGYALQAIESDQVQQAFMAVPESGKHARRNPFTDKSGVFTGDTPNVPLLYEIDVPANHWSEEEKIAEAERRFDAPIVDDLARYGLKPGSPEWTQRRSQLVRRYAFDVPYYQRSERMYQHFNPLIERYIADASSQGKDLADYSFGAFEACMEANGNSKESPVPRCLSTAVEEGSPVLDAFFNRYLENWLKQQSDGYQMEFYSTMDRLLFRDSYRQEMFKQLKTMLIRDYILHQWIDRRHEQANQEMERQVRQLLPKLKRLMELEKSRLAATEKASGTFLQKYEATSSQLYAEPLPPVKPTIRIVWPAIARRIGGPGPIIEVEARGEFSAGAKPDDDDWAAEVRAQVVAVSDAAPPNLLRTPELEQELKPGPEGKARKIISVEDEVEVVVKARNGELLGSEKGTVYWYDIAEDPGPFKGSITVTVKEETPGKPESEWPIYAGGDVALDNQVRKSDLWGTAWFEVKRDGSFAVEVKPREGDEYHKAAKAQVELADPLNAASPEQPPSGKSSAEITLVLPRQEPVRQTATQPAPTQNPASQPPASGAPPQTPAQSVECAALLNSARSMLQQGNLQLAEGFATQALDKECGQQAGIGEALAGIRRGIRVEAVCREIQAQETACHFESALQLAQNLADQAPDAACLNGRMGRLQEMIRGKANTLALLRAAENASRAEDLRNTLALLRQSLATAPPCLAELITPVIDLLEREISQIPAWLELVEPDKPEEATGTGSTPAWLSNGGGTSKPTTDPEEAINHARDMLTHARGDAERIQLQTQLIRLQQAAAQGQQAPPPAAQPAQSASNTPSPSARPGTGKGERWRAFGNAINGVATAILNSQFPGAGIPVQVPGRMPAGGGAGFEGVWDGYSTLTSHQKGSVLSKSSRTVFLFTPQKELSFRISKSGAGYLLALPDGSQAASRYVSGNKVGFTAQDSIEDPTRVNFVISFDLELNGDLMTGTLRMEASDGSTAVRSVHCQRQ